MNPELHALQRGTIMPQAETFMCNGIKKLYLIRLLPKIQKLNEKICIGWAGTKKKLNYLGISQKNWVFLIEVIRNLLEVFVTIKIQFKKFWTFKW